MSRDELNKKIEETELQLVELKKQLEEISLITSITPGDVFSVKNPYNTGRHLMLFCYINYKTYGLTLVNKGLVGTWLCSYNGNGSDIIDWLNERDGYWVNSFDKLFDRTKEVE